VVKGFTQIRGVDYTEKFAPVVNDVTMRTLTVFGLKRGYVFKVYDVDVAFLQGRLNEEIYIRLPDGFEHAGEIVRLNRSLYGLMQAARAWYMRKANLMTNFGFKRSRIDPCVYWRQLEDREYLFVLVYVDDCIAIGPEHHADKFIEDFTKEIDIKILGTLRDYNGAEYEWSNNNEDLHIYQQKLIRE